MRRDECVIISQLLVFTSHSHKVPVEMTGNLKQAHAMDKTVDVETTPTSTTNSSKILVVIIKKFVVFPKIFWFEGPKL